MLTLLNLALLTVSVVARPQKFNPYPYNHVLGSRQAPTNASGLQVDLGYAVYEGTANGTTNLNTFLGIRYAAPPIGMLRWQAPQPPSINRSAPISASSYAPTCPQGPDSSGHITSVNESQASEDCLFINVYSPNNVTGPLPVLVWIHGGGYGAGSGRQDLSTIINTNNNQFVGVTVQYRLGAFGFLSSDEVYRNGVVNAGIMDQTFALKWVQQYISQFNGDPRRVTISGESAGGGSVMLQSMIYGGSIGETLFNNVIAASPYLPMQYGYSDWIPSQSYYAFATAAGCPPNMAYGFNGSTPIFQCLLSKDSATLINASATVVQSGTYGTWAFLPVTDGVFIQDTPSRQLLRGQINGQNSLIGNNANEGAPFVQRGIVTEDDLVTWLHQTFPLFDNNDIAKVLLYYPSSNSSAVGTDYPTLGDVGPTAINQSSVATGQQQRADDIYAETTFICPAYWMAEAFSNNRHGGSAYKYQFSVPPALHGNDVAGYFSPLGTAPFSPSFSRAFQQIWGNFVINNNPSISQSVAVGSTNGSTTAGVNPATNFPPFSIYAPYQINLNETGGGTQSIAANPTTNITVPNGIGASNNFTLVNAYTWEGGRGYRCDFWRAVGEIVPE